MPSLHHKAKHNGGVPMRAATSQDPGAKNYTAAGRLMHTTASYILMRRLPDGRTMCSRRRDTGHDESDGADRWNMDSADDLDHVNGFQRSVEGMRIRVGSCPSRSMATLTRDGCKPGGGSDTRQVPQTPDSTMPGDTAMVPVTSSTPVLSTGIVGNVPSRGPQAQCTNAGSAGT